MITIEIEERLVRELINMLHTTYRQLSDLQPIPVEALVVLEEIIDTVEGAFDD